MITDRRLLFLDHSPYLLCLWSLLFRNKQNKAEKKNRKNTTMSNISRAKMSGKYKYELIRAKSLRLTLIRAEVCRIQDLWHAGKIKKRRSHEMFLYCGWEFFLSVPQIWDLAEAKDWITVTWYAHTSLKYKLVNFWYLWLTFSGLHHGSGHTITPYLFVYEVMWATGGKVKLRRIVVKIWGIYIYCLWH